MQLRTVVLSLLPGAAHIDQGRAKRGLLYFLLFAFFANGAAIAPFLAHGWHVRVVCVTAAGAVWVAALRDALAGGPRKVRRETGTKAPEPAPVPAPAKDAPH